MYDTYVSIDLETTGLNPKRDRIIEIGAIRVEQGQIVEEFSTFVDPGRKLEERITELTGIRDEDIADAPQLDEVFPKLLEFMGELPLLGHSILFDYSFLKKAAVDRKITFERSCPPGSGGCESNGPVVPKAGRAVLQGGNRWTGIDRIHRKESKQ